MIHNSDISEACHEANRAICEAVGDFSQKPWASSPVADRVLCHEAVQRIAAGEVNYPGDAHKLWMEIKLRQGWVYGPVKDPNATPPTHPSLVPASELSESETIKDHVFLQVAKTLLALKLTVDRRIEITTSRGAR